GGDRRGGPDQAAAGPVWHRATRQHRDRALEARGTCLLCARRHALIAVATRLARERAGFTAAGDARLGHARFAARARRAGRPAIRLRDGPERAVLLVAGAAQEARRGVMSAPASQKPQG